MTQTDSTRRTLAAYLGKHVRVFQSGKTDGPREIFAGLLSMSDVIDKTAGGTLIEVGTPYGGRLFSAALVSTITPTPNASSALRIFLDRGTVRKTKPAAVKASPPAPERANATRTRGPGFDAEEIVFMGHKVSVTVGHQDDDEGFGAARARSNKVLDVALMLLRHGPELVDLVDDAVRGECIPDDSEVAKKAALLVNAIGVQKKA